MPLVHGKDILDGKAEKEIVSAITQFNWDSFLDNLLDKALIFGMKFLLVLVLLYVGKECIKHIVHWAEKVMKRRNIDHAVITFISSFLRILLIVVLIVSSISFLGIETVSFTALLASAGVAIGMGLSGQLQNLAGGLIILITKPFKVGDYVSTQSLEGIVKSVMIFHTVIITIDNKEIYLPNGSLMSNPLINYSMQKIRRNQWIIGVEYDTDFEKVKSVIQELIDQEPRMLKDPKPMIVLQELADSSVNIMVRAWSSTDELWDVYWDFNQKVYARFNELGIGFPFPQLTIHQAEK